MPLNLNTNCQSTVTLEGPSSASPSSQAVYQFPEHPATGVMRCVVDSTGTIGSLTFQGTSVLIELPTGPGLHLVTKPGSTDTDWQPRKQLLPAYWVIPFNGQMSSNGTSAKLNNADSGDQGFWLAGMPSSGTTNNVVTVEIIGSVAAFGSASGGSGTFQASFVVTDQSGQTSFATKWAASPQEMFQSNSPLINGSNALGVTLAAAGTGLDCHVMPSLGVTNSNVQVSGVFRITTSALRPGSAATVSEAATPTS